MRTSFSSRAVWGKIENAQLDTRSTEGLAKHRLVARHVIQFATEQQVKSSAEKNIVVHMLRTDLIQRYQRFGMTHANLLHKARILIFI